MRPGPRRRAPRGAAVLNILGFVLLVAPALLLVGFLVYRARKGQG